jgi:GNAT superfamily N-acetyltransferase
VLAAVILPVLLAPRGQMPVIETLPSLVAALAAWVLWRRTTRHPYLLALYRPRTESVRLRELCGGEFDVLDAVFDGLSPLSRFRRFHGATPRPSPSVRDELAAVDGHRHVAVAVFAGRTPIGIARSVAVGGGHAELVVEVVDGWHRRGVGTRLVLAVAERAVAAGHIQIIADVLADNLAAQLVLASVFPTPTVLDAGPEIMFAVDRRTATVRRGQPDPALRRTSGGPGPDHDLTGGSVRAASVVRGAAAASSRERLRLAIFARSRRAAARW